MKLDQRLSACAEFIPEGAVVADIGTDHAYLPVYLVKNGICPRSVAADIGEGPLDAAKKNIDKYLLSDRISTCLSDGLKNVSDEGITHIVIAGMGGETICGILDACEWVSRCGLVLQPMSKAELLRRWLIENGWVIKEETAVPDGRFIYTVMNCVYCGKPRVASDFEAYAGAVDVKSEVGREYIERKIKQLKKSASGKLLSAQSFSDGQKDIALAEELERHISKQ